MILAIRMDPPVVAGAWPRCPRRAARTECGHVPPSARASPGPGVAVTLTSRVLRRLLALRPRECKVAADRCAATPRALRATGHGCRASPNTVQLGELDGVV